MKFSPRAALLAIFLMAVSTLTFAQTSTVLSGTVTDPSNALVPEALVTLTSRTTGAMRTDKTDASGAYNFVQLQPGQYGLKAEKQGFKTTAIGELDDWVDQYPGHSSRPQVEFDRAWLNYKAGNETNALNLFTNLVVQFATNALAPVAQSGWRIIIFARVNS